jgi:hypothetical protein
LRLARLCEFLRIARRHGSTDPQATHRGQICGGAERGERTEGRLRVKAQSPSDGAPLSSRVCLPRALCAVRCRVRRGSPGRPNPRQSKKSRARPPRSCLQPVNYASKQRLSASLAVPWSVWGVLVVCGRWAKGAGRSDSQRSPARPSSDSVPYRTHHTRDTHTAAAHRRGACGSRVFPACSVVSAAESVLVVRGA